MGRIDEVLNYQSPYTNKGGVLKNKFNLEDEELLNKAERMLTSYKLAKLYLDPGHQTFDIEHYKSIHKFLFEDIYPFAGEIRTKVISKRIPFCLPQYITHELKKLFDSLKYEVPKIQSREDLLKFITEFYANLDIIHPFREGNGRTEREFIRQLIDYICKTNGLEEYNLDYSLIEDKNEFINAVVKADALLDYSDLMVLFDRILVVKEKEIDKTFGSPSE